MPMLTHRRGRVLAAALVVVALAAAACGKSSKTTKASSTTTAAKGTITIGAFNFPESAILADIYAGALKQRGYTTHVRANLGTREIVEPALEKGDIDLYPGYAATELEFVNKAAGEASPDAAATVAKLNERLAPKGLEALEPSKAEDENAFAVTKATADKYHLAKLSDLTSVAGQLTLGGPPECPTRPFCAAGLERVYGIKFKTFRPLDPGGPLTKGALEKGDIDVGLIFSSDGAIPAKGFVVLDDDKHLQNADVVVPVIRTKVATSDVKSVLDDVSAKLTTTDLTNLNKRALIDKEDPDKLAEGWLQDHGLM